MHVPELVRKRPVVTALSIVVVTPIVIFTLWTLIALNYTYSSGERAGFLQKVSKRGWLCKTWEGELLLTPVPGTAPEKFVFTTRSDSIAEVLNRLNGQKVVLDYKQHKAVPSSCFGDTEYYVTGARLVSQ